MNIWRGREGERDGTISAISSLLGRDSGRQKSDLTKAVIIVGEILVILFVRARASQPANQPVT